MKKYLLFGIVILIFCYSFLGKEETIVVESPKQMNPHFQKWIASCEASINSILADSKIPGVALAIVKDEMLYVKGFGVTAVGEKTKVDDQTVFRIGSVSKSFASALTGVMVQERSLDWEDKVIDYLPDFRLSSIEQTKRINLKHLLSHTTGLPYHTFTNLVESGTPIAKIIPELKDIKLIGEEGKVYSYQNAAFSIIAEVMEAKTNKEYDFLLKKKIFEPLGMVNASTDRKGIVNNKNSAQPHKGVDGRWSKRSISNKYYQAIPAGGINASINDMGQYLRLLIGNRTDILTEKTLDKIFQAFVRTPIKRRYFGRWPKIKNAYYGMGWRIVNNGGERIAYHGGFVNGYRSEIAINKKEKVGICLLINAPSKALNSSIPNFLASYQLYADSINTWERNMNNE